ncbi:MAG TPA: ABC transporter ATP-binding protein [Euzebyales bacterium]|nr:ABC transporter ATP-binding protein [Euzebyales bacterium]
MLTVDDLAAGYGESIAVSGVSLHVDEGEVIAVIGSNGAGKTTLLRAICGLLPTRSGTVTYDGDRLTGVPAHRVARRGVAYVPAERHLFGGMSVRENLELGAYPDRPDRQRMDLVFELFPRLADRTAQHASTMSGGEQQMLAVGRALMSRPRLLMLDEPTTGLAPVLAEETYASLKVLRAEGLTVLVAEQQVPLALDLADRGYVIEDGVIQLEGPASQLQGNPKVRRAYLGIA